jgi:hypothetical protein
MKSFRLPCILLSIAVPLLVAACGAPIPSPPDYSWTFDVTVTPAQSECVSLDDAGEETFVYGLVVEGDTVSVYSDDSLLGDGTLRGTYISYQSPAPYTDHRIGDDGSPADVEWTLAGHVSFTDQNLTSSQEGEEVITVFYSEDEEIEAGCEHQSSTRWEKRN